MIKKITIQKYKCYNEAQLSFKDITIIVGSNNAGKSTLIEALRLVAYVAVKYKNTNYADLPKSFNLPKSQKGFKIPAKELLIDLRSAIYNFEDGIAKIDVEFDTQEHIIVFLDTENAFACIKDASNNYINSKSQAHKLNICPVRIMPQISLIKDDESFLSKQTVESGLNTRLSSRHFRNELLLYKQNFFNTFKALSEQTWDGLRIQELQHNIYDNKISLMVYDGSFCSEIGNMGSGLQMWLQIIWFLSHCNESETIILDEPDVYMHPDMQKRIYNILKNRFRQIIIATHSVEIIADADPRNIVSIDPFTRSFRYAINTKGAQSIIDNIGGIQNLSLLRLSNAKKCIFVEGDDWKYLSKILKNIFPNAINIIDKIPIVRLGGKMRFEESFGAANLFYNETKGEVQTFCLLDKDYETIEEIEKLEKKADENHLILHIWKKKEIENYFVTTDIISAASGLSKIDFDLFCKILDKRLEELKDETCDNISAAVQGSNRNLNIKNCNITARKILDESWTDLPSKMSIASGKSLLKLVINILKNDFSVKISTNDLINAINMKNIDHEMLDILSKIVE